MYGFLWNQCFTSSVHQHSPSGSFPFPSPYLRPQLHRVQVQVGSGPVSNDTTSTRNKKYENGESEFWT